MIKASQQVDEPSDKFGESLADRINGCHQPKPHAFRIGSPLYLLIRNKIE